MKRIAVLTSGGDAPGMNACIRAVVRTALHYGIEVTGIRRGYQGIIEGDFIPMDRSSVSGIIHLGGTILRSARCEDFRLEAGRQKAHEQLQKADIDKIVVIGGDGSFRGALNLMKEFPDIQMVGCPGTIDNDLFGTDYTIGYDTAINTAMNAIDNIKDTANAHDRLFFIEVMGRDVGYIALPVGIATGAEAILIPETKMGIEQLVESLEYNFQRKKNSSIVVVAEGDEEGGAFKIAEEVKKRSFNRYEIKVTILGHIQRGGRPTCIERVRASRLGMAAVQALLDNKNAVMIGEVNGQIVHTPFEKATKHHMDINPMLLEMVEILS